ncbi:MAG: hypothetical protein QXL94_00010 [Candidatus Parvarchaeum sp.]
MNTAEKVSIIALTVAAIGGIGYLIYRKEITPAKPIITPSTTAVSSMPVSTTAAQVGLYSLNLSNCTCIQGYGGTLTLAECQTAITETCEPLHNATLVYS